MKEEKEDEDTVYFLLSMETDHVTWDAMKAQAGASGFSSDSICPVLCLLFGYN